MKDRLFELVMVVMIAAATFAMTACGGADDDDDDDDDDSGYGDDDGGSDWRDAVPDPASLALALPGEDNVPEKAPGELATLYHATVDYTREVNAHIMYYLSSIDEITSYPPTEETSDAATWGPWIEDGLSPVEMQFVIERVSDEHYSYRLDWRPKTGGDWVTVWTGEVETSVETERRGVGQFTIDFTAAWELDPTINERGTIEVDYDTLTDGRLITISAIEFCGDENDADNDSVPCPTNAVYEYHNRADNSGYFEFDYWDDVHYNEYAGAEYAAYEHVWFNTRWESDGTGRSDVIITDGDIPNIVEDEYQLVSYTGSECWASDFLRGYYIEEANFDPAYSYVVLEEGDDTMCAFEADPPDVD
ncbi:MAG: hypothetical protein IT350_15745 [Deltaproteobacteria bacterium]|nr:hypothetical protein [Deltaproteobacteria bacterium]